MDNPTRGSYGINIWVQDWRPLVDEGLLNANERPFFSAKPELAWGGYSDRLAKGGPTGQVPLIGDAAWHNNLVESADLAVDEPTNGDSFGSGNVARLAVNRHQRDSINLTFMDGHTEVVQHNDLLTFQWHVDFETREDLVVPW